MKIRKHMMLTALAGAIAAAFAMNAGAQTDSAAKPAESKSATTKPLAVQTTFATPEEAAKALADAVRAQDGKAVLAVVGPASKSWLLSGDKVSDLNDWKTFLASYDEKNALQKDGDAKATLTVGKDDWPFPAPIVKKNGKWAFDAEAGREEIVNRRVGRNELDTIQTMLAIVDAQRDYAASDANASGFPDYARRFVSSPGKKDGLYWKTDEGAPQSPLGPLVAEAATEGYGKHARKEDEKSSFHGYHYRMLTAQGKDAPGGAQEYVVGNRLMGGFAAVAWPAKYGSSGVMTFIVNHEGVVYEKDLGAQTASIAEAMSRYNPDATWRKAQQ
ncbi:MAG TPA: DUF2950 domain-containing protein [Usitatibacter sp.]|nr:DUF2950 domain-containing protein [Usitatibacter sp.]